MKLDLKYRISLLNIQLRLCSVFVNHMGKLNLVPRMGMPAVTQRPQLIPALVVLVLELVLELAGSLWSTILRRMENMLSIT